MENGKFCPASLPPSFLLKRISTLYDEDIYHLSFFIDHFPFVIG